MTHRHFLEPRLEGCPFRKPSKINNDPITLWTREASVRVSLTAPAEDVFPEFWTLYRSLGFNPDSLARSKGEASRTSRATSRSCGRMLPRQARAEPAQSTSGILGLSSSDSGPSLPPP